MCPHVLLSTGWAGGHHGQLPRDLTLRQSADKEDRKLNGYTSRHWSSSRPIASQVSAVIAGVIMDGFGEQALNNRIISPLQVSSPGQDLRDLAPWTKGMKRFHNYLNSVRQNIRFTTSLHRGRDSSVGTATRYGMEGPEMESRRGQDFLHPYRPVLGATQSPIQRVPDLSRG